MNMKRQSVKSMAMALTICATLFLCGPAWAVSLSFDPADQEILLGTGAAVDLIVSGLANTDLATFELMVSYDSAILDFDSYVLGTGLGDPGSGDVEDESLGDLGNGMIDLASFTWLTDITAQPDTFTLATLFFTGAQLGTSPLTLSQIDLGDDWGDPISFDEPAAGGITVADPVPEPSTFFLLGIGMLAAAGVGRKFKK